MRFSDLMGSGGERDPQHKDASGSDSAIANAIAPYLDDRAATPTPAPAPAPAPAETAPVEPAPPRRSWQPERPLVTPAPIDEVHAPTSTATIVADFTPLSDDLLPRRR